MVRRDPHTRTVVPEPYPRTLCTGYREYGVRRVQAIKSTDLGTGYINFARDGVRSVRGYGTKEYENNTEYRVFFEVRGTMGTEYGTTEYENTEYGEIQVILNASIDTFDTLFINNNVITN